MYRDTRPKRKEITIMLSYGGMGDFIASFPVIQYILDQDYGHDITLFVFDYLKEFAQFCFPGIKVECPSDFVVMPLPNGQKVSMCKKTGEIKKPRIMFTNHRRETNLFLRSHLTDCASALILGTILEPEEKNYLKPRLDNYHGADDLIPDRSYVVISSMFTSPTRVFPPQEVNNLTNWIADRGYIPVFVGKSKSIAHGGESVEASLDDQIDMSRGVNLINKTDLTQLLSICDKASAVVGVDNGILHLAAMTDVPIVGGFTSVDPKHRLPYRNNQLGWNYYTVEPEVNCKFCQSNWALDPTIDDLPHFNEGCFYKDFKCNDQMTADKFKKYLELILL